MTRPWPRPPQAGAEMKIGVGLPTTLAGTPGDAVVAWARRADEGPFASVATLDRVRYDSYDPFVALAAAAGATRRVRLATTIVIAPLRNTVLLGKAAASLDALSGGRFVLGLAVGARRDDYDITGTDYATRGRRLEEQLAALRDQWEDGVVGPRSRQTAGPPILLGGTSNEVFPRAARYADGHVHGGGPPRAFARAADQMLAAWGDAGRPGRPMLWGQGYFALGPHAEAGAAYLRDYYAFTGAFAERIAAGLLTTPQAIAQFVDGYAAAGCDELVLFPALSDPDQVDRLAEALP